MERVATQHVIGKYFNFFANIIIVIIIIERDDRKEAIKNFRKFCV